MKGTCQACWAGAQELVYDRLSGVYKCARCRAVDDRIMMEVKA